MDPISCGDLTYPHRIYQFSIELRFIHFLETYRTSELKSRSFLCVVCSDDLRQHDGPRYKDHYLPVTKFPAAHLHRKVIE
jgi:hypothetical protein